MNATQNSYRQNTKKLKDQIKNESNNKKHDPVVFMEIAPNATPNFNDNKVSIK